MLKGLKRGFPYVTLNSTLKKMRTLVLATYILFHKLQGSIIESDKGYTSRDLYTGDRITSEEQRLYQVKYYDLLTNILVSQYQYQNANNYMFKHQVPKAKRGKDKQSVYKIPINFHLRLSELTNITYVENSKKIIIKTKEISGVKYRGDVLAYFKYDRAKKRFLTFIRSKGIRIVKGTR